MRIIAWRFWVLAGACALMSSPLIAKSIFDDDYTPDNSSQPAAPAHVTPPPSKVKPAPAPAPAPVAPAPEPQPGPTPAPAPANTPAPATPTPPGDPRGDLLARQMEEAAKRQSAAQKLAAAKGAAEASAARNPDYIRAKAAADDAKKELDAARASGSTEDATVAWTALNKANTTVKALGDQLLKNDQDYQKAKADFAPYGPSDDFKSVATTNLQPGGNDNASPEIAAAIADRRLMVGMTFQQACKAARLHWERVPGPANSTTKVIHWMIKGRLGTYHIESEQSLGRRVDHKIENFGTVAYVEGTFENDQLVDFKRVDLLHPKKNDDQAK